MEDALTAAGFKVASSGDAVAVLSVPSYIPRCRTLEIVSNFLPPASVYDIPPGPASIFPTGWLGLQPYPIPANFLSCSALTIEPVTPLVGS